MHMMKNNKKCAERRMQNQKMTKDHEFAIWQEVLWNDYADVVNKKAVSNGMFIKISKSEGF